MRNELLRRRVHALSPELNGYLHIGYVSHRLTSIWPPSTAVCNLRFDDTNPVKEEDEYVQAIIEDVRWLGYDWGDRLYYASDYFEQMYEYALVLIKKGLAYVCDLSPEEIREYRGTLTEPGRNSPYRDRSVEENLDLFQRMRAGEFPDGSRVLRAKIDMASPNMNMRDPVMYRICMPLTTAQVTNGASIPCTITPIRYQTLWRALPTLCAPSSLRIIARFMTGSGEIEFLTA